MYSTNFSKPSEFFKDREEYNSTYPKYADKRTYDLWTKRVYYGKTDTKGRAVFPIEYYLANLDKEGAKRGLNFVTDAFFELKDFVQRAKNKNAFTTQFLGLFDVARAWAALPAAYDTYFTNFIFDPFLNTYLQNKNVTSFECMVKEYVKFARTMSTSIPITEVGYVLSSRCNNKMSGFIFDLLPLSHANTETKVEDYLKSFEYGNFINLCKNFGFRVNKNAPWQLIADFSSGAMQDYAKEHIAFPPDYPALDENYMPLPFHLKTLIEPEIWMPWASKKSGMLESDKALPLWWNAYDGDPITLNENNLFDYCYRPVAELDYINFKKYLFILYTHYYSVNATYSTKRVNVSSFNYGSPCFANYDTIIINELPVTPLPSPDFDEFSDNALNVEFLTFAKKYGEKYFLDLYFKIRAVEARKEKTYKTGRKNMLKYYELFSGAATTPYQVRLGLQKALAYIDYQLITTDVYPKGQNEFDPYFLK